MRADEDQKALDKELKRWEETTLREALKSLPERRAEFLTTSSRPVKRLYTPLDLAGKTDEERVGKPGEFPYTRGIHPTMYRGRLWTMRMFAGFGGAEDTNRRFKYLSSHGETGLSVAFDMPTLYGYDTDAPEAKGEFGTCGVAVSSLEDMKILFAGIDLRAVSTSMTINSPASAIWAMYLAAAEAQGAPLSSLRGTIQNDILKEYQAQKEWIFPPEPSMRLVVDTFEFGAKEVPLWNTISISGYHIREAGATAGQELAFTLANGMEYVRWGIDRGLKVDDFANRLSFFFNAHNDLFEEIAKYRAARRIWAREMKETYGAKDTRSLLMRFHTQTAGVSLTAQQPLNNIVRTAIEALAGVLGGTQSPFSSVRRSAGLGQLADAPRVGPASRSAGCVDWFGSDRSRFAEDADVVLVDVGPGHGRVRSVRNPSRTVEIGQGRRVNVSALACDQLDSRLWPVRCPCRDEIAERLGLLLAEDVRIDGFERVAGIDGVGDPAGFSQVR